MIGRRRLALGSAAGLVVAGGVALGIVFRTSDEPRKRTDCRVRVFVKEAASAAETAAVGRKLGSVDDVAVRFVSKEEAFKIMRRKYPELAAGLPSNPLPDSYDARTTYADSCAALRAALQPRPPGVDRSKASVQPYVSSEK